MNRTPLRAKSAKRIKADRLYQPIHDAVLERDGRCMAPIVWGTCEGGWDVHHVVSRARAPLLAMEPSNLTTLCRKHHRYAHDKPALATKAGLMAPLLSPQPNQGEK